MYRAQKALVRVSQALCCDNELQHSDIMLRGLICITNLAPRSLRAMLKEPLHKSTHRWIPMTSHLRKMECH